MNDTICNIFEYTKDDLMTDFRIETLMNLNDAKNHTKYVERYNVTNVNRIINKRGRIVEGRTKSNKYISLNIMV